jgi:hypothetical protein
MSEKARQAQRGWDCRRKRTSSTAGRMGQGLGANGVGGWVGAWVTRGGRAPYAGETKDGESRCDGAPVPHAHAQGGGARGGSTATRRKRRTALERSEGEGAAKSRGRSRWRRCRRGTSPAAEGQTAHERSTSNHGYRPRRAKREAGGPADGARRAGAARQDPASSAAEPSVARAAGPALGVAVAPSGGRSSGWGRRGGCGRARGRRVRRSSRGSGGQGESAAAGSSDGR